MDLTLQPAFLAEASTLLILLAGAILLYRSFREKYLVPWMAGWTAYGLAKLFVALGETHPHFHYWTAWAEVSFVISVGLFAGAVFIYVNQKKLFWPACILLFCALILGETQALWLSNKTLLRGAQISWFAVLAMAAVQLVRFSWGGLNPGRWVLAGMLLLLHLDLAPNTHANFGYDILVDLLLGIGMMTMVLDDSQVQIHRLDVLNTLTHQISDSEDFVPAVQKVLKELSRVVHAQSAWFRILEDGVLVLKAHYGVSDNFIQEVRAVELSKSVSGYAMRESQVLILRSAEATPDFRLALTAEGIHHLVMVPVEGESSSIGMLIMGVAHFRVHNENEKSFLKAAAKQIGLAAENRNLVQQVVQSRNEWAATFDSIPDYIFVHDLEGHILHANQALLDRLRLSRAQITEQLCESVLPGSGINWKGCPYCAHGEWSVREDPCFGGYSMVSTSAYTGEDSLRIGAVHVVKDITEAKAAEERYSSLFNQMHEGVFTSTPEGKIIDCNEAFVSMLGYANKGDILKLDPIETLFVHPEQREKFQAEMLRQGFVRNFEFLLRRQDGREINVIENSFATRGPTGAIERYQGVLLDVTEMKRAEDEIRRRNRELNVLNHIAVTFNQSFDLDEILEHVMLQIVELLSTDTASVFLFNEETSTLQKKAACGHRSSWVTQNHEFPLPADFVTTIKAGHWELIDHDRMDSLPEIIQKVIELEGFRSWMWAILWRKEKMMGALATSSRTPRRFSASEQNVLLAVGRQLATTVEKVQLYHETKKAYEDLRRTQEQLLQSEKMSAVGQLISGVAHELNNPLTAILGYTQLLETEKLEPRVQEFIQKLQKQAQRTQKIVQNLLSFARQHKPRRIHVDLRSVMEDSIALRDYDLRINNIVVQRDFNPELPAVVADPHQLEQVYLNIINNAADAMLDTARGGKLRIRIYPENGHVVSEFHDSGPGIADPKHVFDPFYTTKGVGKGTGLGLSICYGIVKEHGGEISARNHPQGGAVLQVRLPIAIGEKPVSEGERIVARRETRLQGRVLLIDDEEAVIDFERQVLAAAGLTVTTVDSSKSAMERLQREEFDAVFLASKIQGDWSSEDLYRWISQSRPELLARTVMVLSNVSDPAIRAFVDATKVLCLVKPFEVADLLAIARRVLRRMKAAAQS